MTNTNIRTFLYILPLLVMACTLTAQVTPLPNDEGGAVIAQTIKPTEQTATASPTLSPAPLICQVKTGIDAGALNLRACGGTHCPVLIVLHEGEALTQTQTIDGWLAVKTAGGLTGWVNSNYTDCEVTK